RRPNPPAPLVEPTAARTTSGVQPYQGPWTQQEVVHLLKRTMFGARPADITYFLGKSMTAAVEELLTPTAPLPSPPVKEYAETNANTPDTDVPAGSTWVNSVNNDGTIQSRRRASLKKWWTGQQLHQDRSIREKMTLFWHNHFATEMVDVSNANFYYRHQQLFRSQALGNVKQLVYDVTLDPAMLVYLNGRLNTATAPDENYARELQELFTLGKENDPNYNEADVRAAARVLTGWRVNNNDPSFPSFFTASRHDTGNKQFSAFYNNTVITGRTGDQAGVQEINDLLNMIFAKSMEVSRYIVQRLYQFFVYSEIDATAHSLVIEPLAQTLRNSNWEIRPVLLQLFRSEHFFDVANRGAQIKSPLDHVIALCREWGVVFPPAAEYGDAYGMWNYIQGVTITQQQNIGDPPSVAGWPAFYQAPQFYQLWVNADTLPKRNQFSDLMIGNGYTRNGKKIVIDAVAYTQGLVNPSDPNQLIREVTERIFLLPLSQQSRDQLKRDFLLTGQDSDHYWTNAWQTWLSSPTTTNYNIVNNRLRGLYKYLMNLAEYQLC
ncbi:MAG TPA: DUF1800 domain-containing protein, partial [Lacibacter sp.]|nr:DUF1800 domain-containing protein [Lacibacter sp.]